MLAVAVAAASCRPAVEPANPSPFEHDDPSAAAGSRPPEPQAAPTSPTPSEVPPSAGTVERMRLNAVLDAGVGSLLAGIEVNPRLDLRDRFVGWEVVRFAYTWADIRPGDVISQINDRAIERPAQVQELWDSLRQADQIVVRGERGEAPLELRFDIVDDAP